MNQNKEEHKTKSVRNRSKGSTRIHSSSSNNGSSSNISDDKHSQKEGKKLKQNCNNHKMLL
eukprot:3613832-Ditylum_brightwellii.AAC.1